MKRKTLKILLPALLVLAVLAGAGAYFIEAVLPEKVATALFAESKIRAPLTQSPKDYGLAYRDVSFAASDGVTLAGWWVPAASGRKAIGTVILSHGAFHNRGQVLDRAAYLSGLGYQVLLFDLRGEGASGDSPISGGLLESKDFLAAEKFLESRKEVRRPLIFFGFSLGAMAALRAAVTAPGVDAVIADSPLANLKNYVSRRTIGGLFSSFPGFLGRCLRDYDALTGLSLNEADLNLIPVVSRLPNVPVLYITGEKDDLARPEEVRKLFIHTPSPHRRLVYIPGAGHEQTFKEYPVVYEKILKEFLTDLKEGFPEPAIYPKDGKVQILKTPKSPGKIRL
jgi:uncharacterized protein